MTQLEHAHDNFRAALAWSVSPDGVLAAGVALAGALGWFWLTPCSSRGRVRPTTA
jgi:hypothetical protein